MGGYCCVCETVSPYVDFLVTPLLGERVRKMLRGEPRPPSLLNQGREAEDNQKCGGGRRILKRKPGE
jgi:hypothetical protein